MTASVAAKRAMVSNSLLTIGRSEAAKSFKKSSTAATVPNICLAIISSANVGKPRRCEPCRRASKMRRMIWRLSCRPLEQRDANAKNKRFRESDLRKCRSGVYLHTMSTNSDSNVKAHGPTSGDDFRPFRHMNSSDAAARILGGKPSISFSSVVTHWYSAVLSATFLLNSSTSASILTPEAASKAGSSECPMVSTTTKATT
mmetsp:Transcript_64418/g.186713  ORF Transcript_64418/g.186713 Transcript_64418/m.186713 type:complete len:201 (-) Transcript_64418:97-699(-)